MKAPHKVAGSGWKTHHKPQPGPAPKPKPPHHKQPPKPKPAPKPTKTKAHRKPRKLSPGWEVACCSAQAVGTLLGWDWERVLGLYWRTASDPDSGASILDALKAHDGNDEEHSRYRQIEADNLQVELDYLPGIRPAQLHIAARRHHGLILGVTLPEPHAIAVTPDGTWWSWGQPFNPLGWPDLVIEEAWCLP